MKSAYLFLIVFFLGTQTLLSNAQVYKWKDKDGSIRYTDTPPPSNIKQETIGSKKTVSPAVNPVSAPAQVVKPDSTLKENAPAVKAEDAAAQIRQKNAEAEKRNKEEKEAEAKRKSDNCKVARANYQSYNQGGRVYKMTENGERIYLGENDLSAGKAQAQREINMNCY
jgi:hypothetical protein